MYKKSSLILIFVIILFVVFITPSFAQSRGVNYMNNAGRERGYFDGVSADVSVVFGWVCKISSQDSYKVFLYASNYKGEGSDCVTIEGKEYCTVRGIDGDMRMMATQPREGTSSICGHNRTGYVFVLPELLRDGKDHSLMVRADIDGNQHFLPPSTNAVVDIQESVESELEIDPNVLYDYNLNGKYDLNDFIILIKKIIGT